MLPDLFAQRQVNKQWSLVFEVEMVFDENDAIARDHGMPGIGEWCLCTPLFFD